MPKPGDLLTREEKLERELPPRAAYMWLVCPDCPEGSNIRYAARRNQYMGYTIRCKKHTLVYQKLTHSFVIGHKKTGGFGGGKD